MSCLQRIVGQPLTEAELSAVMRELADAQHEVAPEPERGAGKTSVPGRQSQAPLGLQRRAQPRTR